ncbi:hypothetical protein BO82DRAFT_33802 [Aspergillus uvarum CBS 121591]|uniref:Uncharacterized protein n=1 Tax=Aspergillus uvarum CBS 121591 TaxID=1448315 RepID=A0A319D729_9EURO|nr:hypothetical protein BO82DRAFT_33802 [Aspergillus uvarum CBS 121591]PYH83758.1 hypothetical protein BO82DRAFT_33802 [Aspergillus uvarum CBS 121591]
MVSRRVSWQRHWAQKITPLSLCPREGGKIRQRLSHCQWRESRIFRLVSSSRSRRRRWLQYFPLVGICHAAKIQHQLSGCICHRFLFDSSMATFHAQNDVHRQICTLISSVKIPYASASSPKETAETFRSCIKPFAKGPFPRTKDSCQVLASPGLRGGAKRGESCHLLFLVVFLFA